MTTRFHSTQPPIQCFNKNCLLPLTNKSIQCKLQDLRELQVNGGESSFGGKSIIRCTNCLLSYTSETLAMQRLKLKVLLNFGYEENEESDRFITQYFWSSTKKKIQNSIFD